MTNRIALLGVTAVTALASVALAQPTLYAVGSFAPGSAHTLYTVNASTGLASPIGSTGLTDVIDLAFDPSLNRLVALTAGDDRYELDPTTGSATLLFDGASFLTEGSLAISTSGTLYTTDFDNLSAASLTSPFALVGPSNLNATDVSGLAFFNGSLYGLATNASDADTLVRFDVTTGLATELFTIATMNTGSVGGLTASPTTLFATSGDALFSIDIATGSATLLGAHGVTGLSGIAFIPAPSALVAFGLLACARRRPRRA
jgi:hypothetical protein